MTTRIEVKAREPHELVFPDGSVLRLRWDASEKGIKVTAEERGNVGASALVVLPRSANGVILKVE